MIKRKKIIAEQVKEGKRKEQLEDEELIIIAREIEIEHEKEQNKNKRIQRAQMQKEALLEDIRKKTDKAKQRMSLMINQTTWKELEREKRLIRAGAQKRKTLEALVRLHEMDWEEEESWEEGGGKTMLFRKDFTLVCASSTDGERKRKTGKKLRWTENAKWRAAEKGKVRRKFLRAARRLPAKIQMEEDMQWLENEAKEGWQGLVDLEEIFGVFLLVK